MLFMLWSFKVGFDPSLDEGRMLPAFNLTQLPIELMKLSYDNVLRLLVLY